MHNRALVGVAALLLMLVFSKGATAYSVLTHMEIVDLAWSDGITPLMLKRYPRLSKDQLREAHAYAYGGSVIQDLGYYPFGSVEFSSLVHYVRSGDFVSGLLANSRDANEYAFALGALAHYTSDIAGHPAVNMAVAMEYPKLEAKYGKSVRFAQGKTAHLKTEFGFDMVQVAKSRYASENYHDFIGFKVSPELIERTFPAIYGMELKDVLPQLDLTVGSYRFAITRLIPELTQIALKTHKKEVLAETPTAERQIFLYRLSRSEYEKEWGKEYQRPGPAARFFAALLRYIPKVGPLSVMAFKSPSPETEEMYFKSINATVDQYRVHLNALRNGSVRLANLDLDDGKPSRAGEYSMADDVYASLLLRQADRDFEMTNAALRANILNFYGDLSAPIHTKSKSERWEDLMIALDRLKVRTPLTMPIRVGNSEP